MLALPVLLAALGSEGSSPPAYVNTAEKLGGVKGTDLTDLQGTKVIGGVDISGDGNHQWVVQMQLVRNTRDGPEAYRCGGSLISDRVILTAAHCFFQEDGSPMNYDLSLTKFYIGLMAEADKFLDSPPHLVREASCYKTHPDYDYLSHVSDIALVYLDEPVPNTWPIAQIASSTSIPASLDVAGWGATNTGASGDYTFPQVLQGTTLNTMENSICKTASTVHSALVQESMVCAYYLDRDTCVGDSGGPLYDKSSQSPILYGITSWGIGCAMPDSPGVYTRLSSFDSWITSSVASLTNAGGCTAGNDGESFGDTAGTTSYTVNGCRCSQAWAIGSSTCSGVDGTVFRGCNMVTPCDGDTGGVAGQSWCILETSDGCSPAGQNWDYCVPEVAPTTSSSTTTTEEPTTTTEEPTTTTEEPDVNPLDNLDSYSTVDGTVPGFIHLSATEMCDPSKNQASSISKYPGEHTHEDCTAFCASEYDCYFASMDWKGRCYLFKTCTSRISKTVGHIYLRTDMPTTPEPSPTEGYTLTATGSVCDSSTSRYASRSSLGGGGYTIGDCAKGCDGARDCFFFFYTSTGFCRMFAECNNMVSHTADTVSYSRDPYQLESRVERCDKNVRGFKSAGGGGHSHEACRNFCEQDVTCAFYVWMSLKGFCHAFTHCGEGMNSPLIEGSDGSMLYSRVNGAPQPIIDDWELQTTTERCDKDGANNVRAAEFSLGGGGWDPYQCAAGCASQGADCTAFTYYPSSGFCHMFLTCVDLIDAGVKGALTYQVAAAERPLKK